MSVEVRNQETKESELFKLAKLSIERPLAAKATVDPYARHRDKLRSDFASIRARFSTAHKQTGEWLHAPPNTPLTTLFHVKAPHLREKRRSSTAAASALRSSAVVGACFIT